VIQIAANVAVPVQNAMLLVRTLKKKFMNGYFFHPMFAMVVRMNIVAF
jgi:hypothetical protein